MSANPTRPTHVLIVDDSAVVRQTMLGVLSAESDLTVDVAADPIIAIEKMRLRSPDVIVLDLEMPRMDGMTFLRKIMREDPRPVIVCSGLVDAGSGAALRALEEGAVDVIAKPRLGLKTFLNDSSLMFIDAIRAAALVHVPRGRGGEKGWQSADVVIPRLALRADARQKYRVIAIGASTGGPEAISRILTELPLNTPGVVVVQHMPEGFTGSFARRLDELCAIEVKEAEPGDEVRQGRALIARGDRHLVVFEQTSRLFVDVVRGPLVRRHRPSVDVLFRSVAQTVGPDATGILLTGMGEDGAEGLSELREAGAWTIAESEESCAVFGMPKAAIARGAAIEVLPVAAIAPALMRELFTTPPT
jgi:two-component system chemotaxis response regulator CheB